MLVEWLRSTGSTALWILATEVELAWARKRYGLIYFQEDHDG